MKKLILAGATLSALAATGVARYVSRVRGPFEPTHYVWSRGLALLCDHNGGIDFVKRQRGGRDALRFDPQAFANVRDGDLVWVRHIALPQFVREVLPNMRAKFGLVTGDEDWAIPSGFADADALLRSPKLVRWFTQNYDGTDESGKISGIPIGLDFHTISNRRKWGHWPATPAAQEAELQSLISAVPAPELRELRVHADFHFNIHKKQLWGDRREDVVSLLKQNPCVVFQPKKVRRLDLWEAKTRYAFVASPHGNGLDCHRTWESLVLGCIPIVCHSPLDPLYDGLPVVILDDWSEITPANLKRWREQHTGAFSSPEVQLRLTNQYWIAHMRRELANALAETSPSACNQDSP
jgi:hypothetical protein